MEVIKGDLLKFADEGLFDVIIHGCNCFRTMGAGIAKSIKEKYPQAYLEDYNSLLPPIKKLGKITSVYVDGLYVVNAYTQYHFATTRSYGGYKVRQAHYEAIARAFEQIKLNFAGMRIGYPMIGAGLAGGDWRIISTIIDCALEGEDHILVEFEE
ncbi:MAG: phosphatase [Desulfobulbaceae bacterium]|nr:phosphatase [Desulfobulbaceae bacterium]